VNVAVPFPKFPPFSVCSVPSVVKEVAGFPGLISVLADVAYANSSLIGPADALGMTFTGRIRSDARRSRGHICVRT